MSGYLVADDGPLVVKCYHNVSGHLVTSLQTRAKQLRPEQGSAFKTVYEEDAAKTRPKCMTSRQAVTQTTVPAMIAKALEAKAQREEEAARLAELRPKVRLRMQQPRRLQGHCCSWR
eukprot:2228446-Amphidinium_carterae.1